MGDEYKLYSGETFKPPDMPYGQPSDPRDSNNYWAQVKAHSMGATGQNKLMLLKRQEAYMRLAAFDESQRRVEGRQGQILSSTQASLGATGFSSESLSFIDYLQGQAKEFQKQNDFARTQAVQAFDLQMQGVAAAQLLDGDKAQSDALGVGTGLIKIAAAAAV